MTDTLIAVPTRGQIQWQTVTALEAARDYMGPGTPPILYQEGSLSVALTRNRIVQKFMRTDHRFLAMVDDDIAPPINFVELLEPHMDEFAMVAIPHASPHPTEPSTMHLTAYDEELSSGDLKPTGLWTGINEVDAVATGCVLISRAALEQIGAHPFEMPNDPHARLRSDDLIFCRKLKRAGLRVGCYWVGEPVDHFRVVSLAPLMERELA
jgi:hypothetical protein